MNKNYFLDPQHASLFECAICLDISFPAVMFPCAGQHVFCKKCILSLELCPHDREEREGRDISQLPAFVLRTYNALRVKCPNECEWIGELGDLTSHLFSCLKNTMLCEFCDTQVQLFEFGFHNRRCGDEKVICPIGGNDCGSVAKRNVEKHRKHCGHLPGSCKQCTYKDKQYLVELHQTDPISTLKHMIGLPSQLNQVKNAIMHIPHYEHILQSVALWTFRRRFYLKHGALDGIYNGAARYRHCGRDDIWILKNKLIGWGAAGNPNVYRCSAWSFGFPKDVRGRIIEGIEEIPDKGWEKATEYGPFVFTWVSDDRCSTYYTPSGDEAEDPRKNNNNNNNNNDNNNNDNDDNGKKRQREKH